jgi:Berberine and berberine like
VHHFREIMGDADDELAAILDFAHLSEDDGRPLVTIIACSTSTEDVAAEALRRLLTVAGTTQPPVALIHRAFRYPSWQRIVDHTAPAGRMNYWKSVFLSELSDDAIDELESLGLALPSIWSRLHVIRLGGEPSRVPPEATGFDSRRHPYLVHLITAWTDTAQMAQCIEWTNAAFQRLKPFAPEGAYLNFIGDEGQDRVRASFGEKAYARLAHVKAQLDPDNRFRLNQNIPPAS